MKNIYTTQVVAELKERVEKLTPYSQARWGKMSVAQMLAHTNVQYEMLYEDVHKPIPGFVKFMLRSFVKKGVVNETPYKKNSGTAPQMIIKGARDFQREKVRLVSYLQRVCDEGALDFENREHMAFGKLSTIEWNNLFYKHLDHHLTQFGV